MVEIPSVSVVMSVYNDAARVQRAIESIISQSLPDWELVVVEDGSTDKTGDVLRGLAERDDRVRVLCQENVGLTRSLIRGCEAAQGQFIARLDADDWCEPTRLEKQVALLEESPSVGFVSCATRYVGPGDEVLETLTRPLDPEVATHGLLNDRQGPPAHGSVMFRRELYDAVGGYREEFYYSQDSDLWLRMAERAQIAYVNDVLYSHRRNPQGISGASRTIQRQFGEFGQECRQRRVAGQSEEPVLAAARQLTESVIKQRQSRLGDPSDSAKMQYLIGSRLAQNGDRRAANYLWPVVRRHPWHWKAWARLLQSRLGHGTPLESPIDG